MPQSTDRVIKVKNKGWFLVNVKVRYQDQKIEQARMVKVPVEKNDLLFFGSTAEFRLPAAVSSRATFFNSNSFKKAEEYFFPKIIFR